MSLTAEFLHKALGADLLLSPRGAPRLPLHPREQQVADSLPAGSRKEEWLDGRTAVKRLLAATHGIEPQEVAVLAYANGAPQLSGTPPLAVSISHTRSWVAAAVATQPLGLDLCEVKDGPRVLRVRERAFSDEEFRRLALVHPADFALAWALKEAALKLTFGGVFTPGLRSVEVLSLRPPQLQGSYSAWALEHSGVQLALVRAA